MKPKPLSLWMTVLLRFAGVFNLLAGTGMIVFYHEGFKMLGVQKPDLALPVQVMGILVGLFGVGYLLVAANPVENRNILMLGFLSKAISSVAATLVCVPAGGPSAAALVCRGGVLFRHYLSAAVLRDFAAAVSLGKGVACPHAQCVFAVAPIALLSGCRRHERLSRRIGAPCGFVGGPDSFAIGVPQAQEAFAVY